MHMDLTIDYTLADSILVVHVESRVGRLGPTRP
jgi:hypothetical protein